MIASIVCLLATDFLYGLMLMQGTYDHQVWLDAGWIGFYLLWGAAALHPTMAEIDQPAVQSEGVLTRFRLSLLAGASLIAPVIGIVDDLSNGDYDFAVVRLASICLFGLVVMRMAGLIRQQERSLERERMLSAAGADLVAATSRDEILDVALSAARAMAGAELATVLHPVPAGAEPRPERPARRGRAAARSCAFVPSSSPRLPLPVDHDRVLVLDLSPQRAERLLLVVAGRATPGEPVRTSLRALAAQVALALERTALTEEVHRRRGEARFGSLVRHASDLITVIGPDGTISYQSPSIERLLGFDADGMVGRRFDELLDPSDRERVRELLADAAALSSRGAGGAPVHPGARERDAAPLRGELHQPAGRRARGRHRAQLPRHQRAQGLRGTAHAPGISRPGHRAREPRAVRRARAARDRAHPAGASQRRRRVPRPRRLQDDQRQPRSCRRRRGPRGGGEATGDQHPRERHRRALRGRRVRAAPRGHRRGAGGGRYGRPRARVARPAAASRPQGALAPVQHRHLGRVAGRGGRRGGADPRRRRRDVPRQARRQGQLPDVRARDARGRARPARASHRSPARDSHGAAGALLPAGGPDLRRQHHGGRGAASVAPSGARDDSAGPVHPARRGNRPDHPDRPVGAARGLSPRTKHAGRPSRRRRISR